MGDWYVGVLIVVMVGGDLWCWIVLELGYNLGGFGGIGWSDVVVDKGVDESGFFGFECVS